MKSDRNFLILTGICFLTLLSWVSSCKHKPDTEGIPEVCFEKDVLPVFLNNCAVSGCHDGTGESKLVLTSYVPISHSVEPGKPYSSKTYKAIISSWGEERMPPTRPLPVETRMIIKLWIEQGARLTTCNDTAAQNGDNYNPLACFSRDILPVLLSRCGTSGCHDAATHKEGYVFTSYSTTITSVLPGNPANSKLYKVITKTSGEDKMPPAGSPQLTLAEIDSIAAWIRYGAPDQYCGELCDTVNPVTFSAIIWPAVQASCTGCHSGNSPSGGIPLTNYNDVAAAASNGSLLNALKGAGVTRMPPGNPFSNCRIRQFEIWINDGHLNN